MTKKFGAPPRKAAPMALRYPDSARNSGRIKSSAELAIEAGVAHRGRNGQLHFRLAMNPTLVVLCEKQQYACAYCGTTLDSQNATLDHVLALSRGGSVNAPENLVASCFSCNNEKGDRLLHSEWTPPNLRVTPESYSTGSDRIVHTVDARARFRKAAKEVVEKHRKALDMLAEYDAQV